MDFFDDEKNVRDYIEMARGYDGRDLIKRLRQHLPPGSTVLELGMGPGIDLEMLELGFNVTGSDSSQVFLNMFREKNPGADILRLDATTLETDRKFDAIYSNKVLHHLRREDLMRSLERQSEVVRDGGILCHSFWRGAGEEEYDGLRFVYYTENELLKIVSPGWEILELDVYREMETADSILLIAKLGSVSSTPSD